MNTGAVVAKKLFNFKIEQSLHNKFKKYCFENNTNMTDLIIGYIESVIRGEAEAKKRTVQYERDFDPLEAIRQQYKDER